MNRIESFIRACGSPRAGLKQSYYTHIFNNNNNNNDKRQSNIHTLKLKHYTDG